ncbi:ATP-dependent sacrificial sulfur transferase LarE [Acidobacteriia bacterium AH_259_A11_L15]|nr:ATP-dependent sacrificial sulfur transferase LarE [Acidobacteriia bacterium AH_259_A11_L15]
MGHGAQVTGAKLTSTSRRQPQSASAAEKQRQLQAALAELPSLMVALSGGTDSAYLAWVAQQALGDRALAVTAVSPSLPERERDEVEQFVQQFGIAHEFIRTEELTNPLYVANHPDRCYHCKDELFDKLGALARERGIAAVAYGVNVDDQGDFRPGQQAAREHRILTPLLDAGLTKAEIRQLSRRAGLPTWDKPAAACLASRLAPGIEVTDENLKKIERGEEALRKLGFRQVRVRYHDELVRIEIAPEELPRALSPAMARRFTEIFKALGFRFVTLDLEGYRQGSFNPQR